MARAPANRSFRFILLFSITVSGCSFPDVPTSRLREAWDYENDPGHFDVIPKKFVSLPSSGQLPENAYPWTDDYWPTYGGGISRRWQSKNPSRDYKAHMYKMLDEESFSAIPSAIDVGKLSPSEKFDLYMDRYDFPLTKQEQERMMESVDIETGKIPSWFGLCHGLAPASLMEPEPGPMFKVKNAKGIEIPFYSSDVKALLSSIYANAGNTNRFLGTRCHLEDHELKLDENGRVANLECRDVNPGAFHLVLAELLGNPDESKRQGFVIDLNVSSEVWNHAVVGYNVKQSDIVDYDPSHDPLKEFRAPGTARLAHIAIYVMYTTYSNPSLTPFVDAYQKYTKTAFFAYTLELDSRGVIIGGEWKSRDRPDFIWMLKEKPKGTDLLPYTKVQELMALSRGETPSATPSEPLPDPDEVPPSSADSAAGVGEGMTPHALGLPEFPLPIF